MYQIHIAYTGADRQKAAALAGRLKWYYLQNRRIEKPNIFLGERSALWNPQDAVYLIVICSLHTPQDLQMEETIRLFLRQMPVDHVIPYVVGGTPYAKDGRNECVPRILRQQMQSDLLAIDALTMKRRTALHRIISTIHNISMEELEKRSRRQQIRRGIIAALIAGALLLYSGYSEYTTGMHTEYYRSFSYAYGVPVGVERLGFLQRQTCEDYYVFEVNDDDPLLVKRVGNPEMTVRDSVAAEYYAAIDTPQISFSYQTDGTLDAAVHADEMGNILFVINYSANNTVADLSELPDGIEPYGLQISAGQTPYSRCVYTYDLEGNLTQIQYYPNSRNVQ